MTVVIVILSCLAAVLLICLLMIMPRMTGKADKTGFEGVLYAHRGLHDNASDAPENSMRAFGLAVEKGFGIEFDVQLTKDKVPVVFHDFTLKRVCGEEGRVCDYTYDQLTRFRLCDSDQRIPRLEEVLQLIDGKVPLIIEYKTETTDLSVCAVADGVLQGYRGLYCIESFNPLAVLWYRKNRPGIMRGQLADAFYSRGERRGVLYLLLQNLCFNFLAKPDFVAYNHGEAGRLPRVLCRKLYKNTAVAWTIKSEEELSRARAHFDLFIFDSFVPSSEGEKRGNSVQKVQ